MVDIGHVVSRVQTDLTGLVSSSATDFPVTSSAGFKVPCAVLIGHKDAWHDPLIDYVPEIVWITSIPDGMTLRCILADRGISGTAARSHDGTTGNLKVTAIIDQRNWERLREAVEEPSLGSTKLASDPPSTYPRGVSYHHGTEANGWPALGPVLTTYPLNEIWITQVQIPASGGTPLRRTGRNDSDVWFSWRQDARASNGSYTGDGNQGRAIYVSEEPAPKQVQITRRGSIPTNEAAIAWTNKGSDHGFAMLPDGSVHIYSSFVLTNSGFTLPSQLNVTGAVYDYTAVG